MKVHSVITAVGTAALLVAAPVIGPVWADSPQPVSPELQTVSVRLDGLQGVKAAAAPSSGVSAQPNAEAGQGTLESAPIAVRNFSMVGATWTGKDRTPSVEVRVATGGRWQAWQKLSTLDSAPDPGAPDAGSAITTATEPLWVGDSDQVQVRVRPQAGQLPDQLDVRLVDPGTSAGASAQPLATAGAAAARPAIISRAQWGADERLKCNSVTYMSSVKGITVHHTAGGNSYSTQAQAMAQLRADYAYHTKVLGWCDLGYNFVVDKWGNIYEGRAGGVDKAVQGAHAGGFNASTAGISALGNYSTTSAPPAMVNAISRVAAWKLGMYGVSPTGSVTLTSAGGGTARYAVGQRVTLPVIFGHRDVGLTECPGNNLYSQLPAIRTTVQQLQGTSQPPAAAKPVPRAVKYSTWQSLGGAILGRPAAVAPAPGRLDVVAVGSDKAVYLKSKSSSWSSWQSLGGATDLSPAVSSWGSDRRDVFVRGQDRALWQRTYENGAWSAWRSLGGTLASSPAAVSSRPGRIDVLVQGTDKALWHRAYDNGTWSSWSSLGGALTSGPAATSDGEGRVDVVAVGSDRAVWHRSLRGSWTPWLGLGGDTGSDAAVTAPAADTLEIATTGTDRHVKRRAYSVGWQSWSDVGGTTSEGPALASAGDGSISLAARGTDGAVWLLSGQSQ
ncbi:MAG: N-acetylmuramoyl-L-alanine amidase [Actinomycetes bacterium]